MEFNLKDKVAVVTGASRGIGAGIALTLGKAGAHVIVNYVYEEAAAQKVVEQIKQNGGSAIALKADVSKAADVAVLFETIVHTYKKVDIVVNNAGIFAFEPVSNITEQSFLTQFRINV